MLSRYDGAIGVKTVFTKKSGRCLISAAKRDGLTLIAVTLNAPDDWRDHTALLDFGFEHFERKTLFDTGEFYYDLPLSNADVDFVRITHVSPITVLIRKGASTPSTAVECHFRFAVAPVKEGQILGRLCVSADGKDYFSSLICKAPINAKRKKHAIFN
jgi:D-alanyl-D-alanine carboxypeptidase/D-alanyl-D-alanine carboxypeptidase (penicillin-binding protein 5/6)